MQQYRGIRVVSAERRGSSRPIVIETAAGEFVTKLRGAAQGPAALVAEVIVATLAEAIDLSVPARALIFLDEHLECADRDPEVIALLRASHGWNLGFQKLDRAREFRPDDIAGVDRDLASRIVWLDGLVMNPDRTRKNPNLLIFRQAPWLIDHGAALGFQHNWPAVTEQSPRRAGGPDPSHVLFTRATGVSQSDERLAARTHRSCLSDAIREVPDDFLLPLLPAGAPASAVSRRRDAYCAFLWKRLTPPRPFVPAPQ